MLLLYRPIEEVGSYLIHLYNYNHWELRIPDICLRSNMLIILIKRCIDFLLLIIGCLPRGHSASAPCHCQLRALSNKLFSLNVSSSASSSIASASLIAVLHIWLTLIRSLSVFTSEGNQSPFAENNLDTNLSIIIANLRMFLENETEIMKEFWIS